MLTILASLGIGILASLVMFLVLYLGIWAMNHNDDRVAVGFLLSLFALIISIGTYFMLVNL